MGLLSRLKFWKEEKKEPLITPERKDEPMSKVEKDFTYGVGYGSLLSQFEYLKDKVNTIHQIVANDSPLILDTLNKITEQEPNMNQITTELNLIRTEQAEHNLTTTEHYRTAPNKEDIRLLLTEQTEQLLGSLNRITTEQAEQGLIEPAIAKHIIESVTLTTKLQDILNRIAEQNQTTTKQLAEEFHVSKGTMSEHLDKLVKLGRIKRLSRGVYASQQGD